MRKTKVVGFSLPPQTEKNLKTYLKKTGKTRSELMREMIDLYFTVKKSQSSSLSPVNLSDLDLNKILKLYYEMMGMNKKAVIVIGLGIIVKGGKVLIGQRKGKDPHIKDLSWVFPGGRFNTLDFRQELKREVKEETNLDVEVLDIIHARLIPDSPEKKVRVVAQYFHCKPLLSDIKPGGDLIKLKWVKATSVCKYFTTSTADEIMHFLGRAV
jgi:8-oxo-dGTP pyrophosphatase MutT (NUDIX family)